MASVDDILRFYARLLRISIEETSDHAGTRSRPIWRDYPSEAMFEE